MKRLLAVWVYSIAFFLSIIELLVMPNEMWSQIDLWQMAIFGFQRLVGVSAILIAYWVYDDGDAREWLEDEVLKMRDKVSELEKKIRASD